MINQSTTLQELVSIFEQNELGLDQIPQNIIDRYGYACLANSLMFKEPVIPKYNIKIVEVFQKHNFTTLDSLISFIKKLKNDINKLFAIFTYAALNIEYDVDLYFSDRPRTTPTLEQVFETKKAVCSGYSLFFIEMAKRVNIDSKRIIIKDYSNFAKGYGYNPLNEPSKITSNHSSVFISIDGVPFISEPTWASGHINKDNKFERNFRHQYFLIPFVKTLCDHFPINKNGLNFSFKQFFKAIKINPFDRCLKTESNPYVNISCTTGFLEQKYSCNGPLESISFRIYVKNGQRFEGIDTNGISSYQIIQTRIPRHEDRCRFKTCIAFPQVGFYKIQLFIDTHFALEYYVDNRKKCQCSVPAIYNPFHEEKFIPIKPKCVLSNSKNGAIIRFAISKKKSKILWDIIKLQNHNNFELKNGQLIDRKYGQYIQLELPFDDDHYENQLCVIFPSNGRFCVKLYIENDEGTFTSYTNYFFDVNGDKTTNLPKSNPIYYMFKGRKFAPLKLMANGKEVEVIPNASHNLVNERNQVFKFKPSSKNDKFYFELRKRNEKSTIQWPAIEKVNDGYQQIKFSIPNEFGEYELNCWVNDVFCIAIPYIYTKMKFKEPSETENNLLIELRDRINAEKVIDHEIKATLKDSDVENEVEAVNDRNDVRY